MMSASASNSSPSVPALVSQMPHAIWRADQMASGQTAVTPSGYPMLDAELPNGGWPASALIELLLQQPGIGEIQLLKPALAVIARQRRIVLVQPPHLPQLAAWAAWGLPVERLLWIKTRRSADALWSAEQILRNGSCGALLFWQTQVRSESLRRLHLAAQGAEIVFWMIRPLTAAQDSSPAPLRLGLRPAQAGVQIDIVKRRGPQRVEAFYLALHGMPAASSTATSTSSVVSHALLDRRALAAISPRNISPTLV
jgi:protein ImuA